MSVEEPNNSVLQVVDGPVQPDVLNNNSIPRETRLELRDKFAQSVRVTLPIVDHERRKGTTEQAAGDGFHRRQADGIAGAIETPDRAPQRVSHPSSQAGAAIDVQCIHVRTTNPFEPSLHQSTQHQVHVPASLSQNADQLCDALIVAGSRRIRDRIADDCDLSAGLSGGRDRGGGHRPFESAKDFRVSAPWGGPALSACDFYGRDLASLKIVAKSVCSLCV